LLDEMMPHLQAHPEMLTRDFWLCVKKAPSPPQ
jgi:hypothetical protein